MPSVARLWVLPGLVVGISLIFLFGLFGSGIASAQTSVEGAIREPVRKGLDAYQRKDVDAMFAVFSSKLPLAAAFKWDLQNDLAALDKIEIKNVSFRTLRVSGDKATLSLSFDLYALNRG